jgi:malonyl-CoA/methylmalonyl-CoA synthetase
MGPAMAMAMGASRLCGRGTRTRVAASSVRLAGSCPNHPATSFHGSRCRHSHNDDTSAAGVLPVLLARAASHPGGSVATLCARGETTYAQLLRDSEHVSAALQRRVGGSGGCVDLRGARVAFLCPPGRAYIGALWGTWRAGGVTVPLCTTHPAEELRYVLQDCGASVVLVDDEHRERLAPLAAEMSVPLVRVDDALREGAEAGEEGTAEVAPVVVEHTRRAHIVYTSGTTGRPKAVVHTHQALGHQVSDLVHAWEWQAEDRILHFLPLHHSHGIINKLCCPLWAGATVEFLPRYSAAAVWRRLLLPVQQRRETCSSVSCPPINVLMAVPTIYSQLIEAWDECLSDQEREDARVACAGIRLMVSGSASLPLATLWRWHEISGHVLLERYGMTEFAMALSNPLSEPARRPGFVGAPLPSMEVKVCAEEDEDEAVAATTVAGQQLGGEVAVPHVPVPVGEAGACDAYCLCI